MAYQTGSASTPSNLLDTIRLFALANSWTVNYWGADTQTNISPAHQATSLLCLTSPAGGYFMYMAYDSTGDIYTSGATGYSATGRNQQPGHPSGGAVDINSRSTTGWAQTNLLLGPFAAYYLFGGASYIHTVVEVVTNRFMHFHIGTLEKAGNYEGGEYFTNTYWSDQTNQRHDPNSPYHTFPFDGYAHYGDRGCHVRCDVDGAVNRWVNFYGGSSSSNYAQGFLRYNSLIQTLMNRSPNTFNGLSTLHPSIVTGPRPLGGSAIYGTVKDLRPVNITYLEPKQILTIGGDDWMIFPITRKGSGTLYEIVSGVYGIAYRKVV